MVQAEQLIIEKLLAFRETQAEKHLQDALKILETAASTLNHGALLREINEKHLRKEWEIVRNSYLLNFTSF